MLNHGTLGTTGGVGKGHSIMRLGKALFSCLALAVTASADAATIQNVSAQQRPGTKIVDIQYDLVGGPSETIGVQGFYSLDGGSDGFPHRMETVQGDVGGGVSTGTAKQIMWFADSDAPDLAVDNAQVMLCEGLKIEPATGTAIEGVDRPLAVTYQGAPYTSSLVWTVNGIEGGNSTVGTVQAGAPGTWVYTAPLLVGAITSLDVILTAEEPGSETGLWGSARLRVARKAVAISSGVSFLNALEAPPGGVESAFSRLVSYLNALEPGEKFQASRVVSYENQ